MKRIIISLIAIVVAMSVSAAPVDYATALKKVNNYLANKMYPGMMMSPSALNPVLLKAEMGNSKLNQPVYYIFNTSTTYLVVAGDDRAEEILMEGDAPLQDINNLPPGMIDMLSIYKDEIDYLLEHPGLVVKPLPSPKNTPSLKAVTISPMLTALWDQEAPYWNQCRFSFSGYTYQCYTGCPATSASMVMYYWKYPLQVAALPSYTALLNLSFHNSVSYTYPALPATSFDWNNMKDSYTGDYTSAQGTAVATLMRYVGQAEGMKYGTAASSGSSINVSENYRIADMFKLFGYKSTATNVQKSSYDDADWAALIQSELIAGRPLVYCAIASTGGGHAFNVDGYRDSDNKYHVNWGWSGEGNNWFVMNAFMDGSDTFDQSQQAIIGVEPPDGAVTTPVLTVNPTSLSFTGCSTGETYTETFTVSGRNLVGNVTLSSSNPVFTISPSTLTAAQASAGATITVTYKPTAAGTQNDTITVSSSDAESKTVYVSGTAALETYDPVMLEASNITSTSFTATWTDETPAENVESYTLYVSDQPFKPAVVLLDSIDWTQSNAIPAGWSQSGLNYFSSNRASYLSPDGYVQSGTYDLTGYDKVTVMIYSEPYNGDNTLTVTTSVDSKNESLPTNSSFAWYTFIVNCASSDYIRITSSGVPDMRYVKVYAGEFTAPQLKASESGDETYRVITGITDKTYTVTGLTSGGSFYFYVEANYINGGIAPSIVKEVTLLENEHTFQLGDVDHDGKVGIADVTELINFLLGGDNGACLVCGDVETDGKISIADVTALINHLLRGSW